MKHSHLKTPRTLSEGQFAVGYQSINSSRTRHSFAGWLGWVAFAILALSMIAGRV